MQTGWQSTRLLCPHKLFLLFSAQDVAGPWDYFPPIRSLHSHSLERCDLACIFSRCSPCCRIELSSTTIPSSTSPHIYHSIILLSAQPHIQSHYPETKASSSCFAAADKFCCSLKRSLPGSGQSCEAAWKPGPCNVKPRKSCCTRGLHLVISNFAKNSFFAPGGSQGQGE
jgi:hypothetical protein